MRKDDELFNEICSIENLFLAWDKFRRGKRKKLDVMDYERKLEDNLFILRHELLSGEYQHGPYQPFTIYDPKKRRIHKAEVRDRMVHQAIVNIIEPIFEKQFIYDSYSCRKNKGTHAAIRRLRKFVGQAGQNHTRTVHALKCDIKKFFDSVNHEILLELLGRKIDDERVLSLLKNIIASFQVKSGKGIPLGNLTSQLFANIFLHELDHFIKNDLREKYYLRYCDDFVLLGLDRDHLGRLVQIIDGFLQDHLKLVLHPNKIHIRTLKQGIDFLGYVILEKATVLRTKTKRRVLKRVNCDNSLSYLGLCLHANCHELTQQIQNRLWLD